MGNSNQNHSKKSLSHNHLKNNLSLQIHEYLQTSKEKTLSQTEIKYVNPLQFKPTENITYDKRLLFLSLNFLHNLLQSPKLTSNLNLYSTSLFPPSFHKLLSSNEINQYLNNIENYTQNNTDDLPIQYVFPHNQLNNASSCEDSSDSDTSFCSSDDNVKNNKKLFHSSKKTFKQVMVDKRRSSLPLGRIKNLEKISSKKVITKKFVDSILKSAPIMRQFFKEKSIKKNEVRSSTISASQYLKDKRNSIRLDECPVSSSSVAIIKCSSKLEKIKQKGQLSKYSNNCDFENEKNILMINSKKTSLKKNKISGKKDVKSCRQNVKTTQNNIVFMKTKKEGSLNKCLILNKEIRREPVLSDKKNKTLNEKYRKSLVTLNDQLREKSSIKKTKKEISNQKMIKIDIRKLEADTEAEEELNIFKIKKLESEEFHLDIGTVEDLEKAEEHYTNLNKKFLTIPKEYPFRQRRSFEVQKSIIDPIFLRKDVKHKTTKKHSIYYMRSLMKSVVNDESDNRKSDVCFPKYKVDLNPLNSDLTYNEKLEVFRSKNDFLFKETEEEKALKEKLKSLTFISQRIDGKV